MVSTVVSHSHSHCCLRSRPRLSGEACGCWWSSLLSGHPWQTGLWRGSKLMVIQHSRPQWWIRRKKTFVVSSGYDGRRRLQWDSDPWSYWGPTLSYSPIEVLWMSSVPWPSHAHSFHMHIPVKSSNLRTPKTLMGIILILSYHRWLSPHSKQVLGLHVVPVPVCVSSGWFSLLPQPKDRWIRSASYS